MTLDWDTCGSNGNWCSFEDVNLSHSHFLNLKGVYIAPVPVNLPWK